MQIARSGSLLVFVLGCVLGVNSQVPPASAAQSPLSATVAPSGTTSAQSSDLPPSAITLNDVLDRVVQREHLFMAQMRHMHPLVETYLQDLKNDSDGNAIPVKDQYFLGRLDMSEGPEDISFVGQPGFGHRMLGKLTGIYALR